MPDRPRRPWIGIPAHPGFAAAERLAAEHAAAHAARQAALQPSRFELVVPQIDHGNVLAGIEQANRAALQQLQAELPYQRGLQELERLAREQSAWRAELAAEPARYRWVAQEAQAFAAGMDTAAAERHAAMIKAAMVDARTSEILSDYSRAQINALHFGQQPFGRQFLRDLSRDWDVQEQPDSSLVVVKRRGGGIPGRRRWAALATTTLNQLRLRYFELNMPTATDFARSYWLSEKSINRRLHELTVAGWRAFVKMCRSAEL